MALIDRLRVEWAEGLNVLTGETGAGKSIILEALGLALGERASTQFIRQGETAARVTAVFSLPKNPALKKLLKEKGLSSDQDLLLRRELDASGKSRAYVNDEPVSLATLFEIGEYLVDIHGQHEHQRLLKPAEQRALLDAFGNHEMLLEEIEKAYQDWSAAQAESDRLKMDGKDRAGRLDLLSFQWKEIEAAALKAGEEEEWERLLPQLKNSEKLRSLSEEAYSLLYGDEAAVLTRVGSIQRILGSMKALGSPSDEQIHLLEETVPLLEEVKHYLDGILSRADTDPAQVDRALGRLDLIGRLKRKYGASTAEIIAHGEKIKTEWEFLSRYEENQAATSQKLEEARTVVLALSQKLSQKRKRAAERLARLVEKEGKDLGLALRFECQIETTLDENGSPKPGPNGTDTIEFLMAANPGEPLKPLRQTASGGEMSRIMLALKTVLAASDQTPVLVFDEIDAGVSGPMAQVVGRKLQQLGETRQILCVTHMPQIASLAHRHVHVSKDVKDGRTQTRVQPLDPAERVEEIARMLGGQKLTPASVQHAKEMLQV